MIRKKKNFPRWINQSSCTYCSTSLRFPYSKKKKIHRITLYRISNDNGSTRNGSRFSREKKTLGIFLARFEEVARSERSNGVEREGILIWISSAAVTDHLPFHRRKFLPPLSSSSSPPLPCSRRPTRGSTKPLRIDLPLLLLRVIPLRS